MITIIAGTNRRGSLSSVFANEIASIYRRQEVQSKVLEIADLPLETFSPDAYEDKPAKVLDFTDHVLNSSGLVMIVPEYNGSMPGALKLFIDHLPYLRALKDAQFVMWGLHLVNLLVCAQ